MNAFSAAVDAIFADPNMAVDAAYRSGGADPATSIRAIKRAPDEIAEFNSGRFVSDTVVFDLRVSDVANLTVGDTLAIDGDTYQVFGEPRRDSERLVWTAEVRPVAV
ncbi:MAG: head-tail joining protein [Heliomarina sp.]|uniref:head-tail joining protein n=1 Tax=Heliomarina sp. TaxID=2917556 RepID=UPI00405802BD